MVRNVYTSLATLVGLLLLCQVVLDRVRYTDFLVSLLWR